ncbi:barstar family protein [Micromonospora parathelypteridis]|uniref:RNAse (Barnase) inhibitor barstar n=1 Tax=Micromonospora parathelypteridis TaxID=1839617 RepID=A0A840VGL1_9ACTN|nr:barstar family protein [Micromonospora parathelypteridis]MBB5475933.1 RNAse (barnase) inhibitor barstar [Micromonospora parathelypteridis]GGO32082.1 hypothetical protein GCM10011576_61900 [Micromonospora parathelypteridis]
MAASCSPGWSEYAASPRYPNAGQHPGGYWRTEHDLHRDIAAALSFPDYYGRNLDALNDCMRDVVSQDYGWAPSTTGLALVFTDYDAFAAHCSRAAQVVLDIMADHSRSAALFGRRLMCLVQSNDPHIRFAPVGATPVLWNDAEWLDSKRSPNSSAAPENP